MDVSELCRSQVEAYSKVEWNLDGIVTIANQLGLTTVTRSVSAYDPDCAYVTLTGHGNMGWVIAMSGGEFASLSVDLLTDSNTYLVPDDVYDAKLMVFASTFRQLDGLVREIFGPPAFSGRYGSPGFPAGYSANYATSWRLANKHLLLSYEDHKRGDPLIISLVALPIRDQ